MEMLYRYFTSKKESYHWLLTQIEGITKDIRLTTDEMIAGEQKKITQSCQNASAQQISSKVEEMAKFHHLHLQSIVQLFIASMRNLSLALKPRPSDPIQISPQPAPQTLKSVVQVNNFSPVHPIVFIPQKVEPKIEISIPSRNTVVSTQTIPKNAKPQIIQNSKKSESRLMGSIIAKTQQKQECVSKTTNNSSTLKSDQLLFNQKSQVTQEQKSSCVQDCLELDHKIYNQANDYLNSVLKSQKRGMSPLRKSFLTASPITKLQVSRKN